MRKICFTEIKIMKACAVSSALSLQKKNDRILQEAGKTQADRPENGFDMHC